MCHPKPGDDPRNAGSTNPWRSPATSKISVLRANASLTGLPDPSFLFAVFVNDKAGKLFKDDD